MQPVLSVRMRVKGIIHRAHQLCDHKEDLLRESQLLRNVFVPLEEEDILH